MNKEAVKNLLFTSRRMSRNLRWGTYNFNFYDNVSSHTGLVVLYADVIARLERHLNPNVVIDNAKVLKMAVYHDLPEAMTGDINYVVKNYIANNIDNDLAVNLDKHAILFMLGSDKGYADEVVSLLTEFENATSIEGKIVKAADILESIIYLMDEGDRGNRQVDSLIGENCKRLLDIDLECTFTLRTLLEERWGDIVCVATPNSPGRV